MVKEIFEKARLVQGWRIRIPFSIIADFGDPVGWFPVVEYGKKSWRIQERTSGVVQNAKLIRINADHGVWRPDTQIAIPRASLLKLDDRD